MDKEAKIVVSIIIIACIAIILKYFFFPNIKLFQKQQDTKPVQNTEQIQNIESQELEQPQNIEESIIEEQEIEEPQLTNLQTNRPKHSGENFVEYEYGENFIELRYYSNSVVGDSAVFSAAHMPEPSLYPEVKLSEIYANYEKQVGNEKLLQNICLAMYEKVQYDGARIYLVKNEDIAYIEGFAWSDSNRLTEWKYENGELIETDF